MSKFSTLSLSSVYADGESKPASLKNNRIPVAGDPSNKLILVANFLTFRLENPKCPIDGKPISRDESFRDKCCEREVLNLQCFCRYKGRSCDWKGEFKHLKVIYMR